MSFFGFRLLVFGLSLFMGAPFHLKGSVEKLPIEGSWYQIYSNFYVQSTSEIDYRCVTVRANQTKTGDIIIQKQALEHGNSRLPLNWSQFYSVLWQTEDHTVLDDNLVLVPSSNNSALTVPIWVRHAESDYIIWTGKDNKTLFVWSHSIDNLSNPKILTKLAELDFTGRYKLPVPSYSASCMYLTE